jgi:molybdopterin molybdotransferase
LFARKGRCLVFGLPGNPVSTFIGFSLLVAPALRRIMGYPAASGEQEGVLQREVRNESGRLSFFPARLIDRGHGGLAVYPVAYAGSADLPALARGNGFFYLGAGCRRASKGSKVRVVGMGVL